MLVAAMTTPWAILDQLQSWAALLGDHIDKLPLDNDTRQRCRQLSKLNKTENIICNDILLFEYY